MKKVYESFNLTAHRAEAEYPYAVEGGESYPFGVMTYKTFKTKKGARFNFKIKMFLNYQELKGGER